MGGFEPRIEDIVQFELKKKWAGRGWVGKGGVRDGEDGFEPNIEDIVQFKTIIKNAGGSGVKKGGEFEPTNEDIVQLKKRGGGVKEGVGERVREGGRRGWRN